MVIQVAIKLINLEHEDMELILVDDDNWAEMLIVWNIQMIMMKI